jgi:type IV pilus assembly protein PilO
MKAADLKNIDFKALAEDFKNLDPKDIGAWPLLPRASVLVVLFAVILGAGWWFVWKGQMEDLAAKRQEEVRLKEDWQGKKRQAVNLDLYQAQKTEINRVFGALLKQLPNKTEIEALLVEVNQSGLGRGLQFELFRPGTETTKEFISEVPITVRLTGTYHDLGAFASDIGRLSRIVTLNNLSLVPVSGPGGGGVLALDAVTLTYRALDDDEVSKQKQGAKGAKR